MYFNTVYGCFFSPILGNRARDAAPLCCLSRPVVVVVVVVVVVAAAAAC
jgi:hypothetical protein